MSVATTLLPEYDEEMAATRRLLERVPSDRLEWRPHAKSMTMGRLAAHLSTTPAWVRMILRHSAFEFEPIDEATYRQSPIETLLAFFDSNVAAARRMLATTPDDTFQQPWTLKSEGKEVYTKPRMAVVRNMLLNHIIHHRGQLTVYLRLNDVPLPPLYGPTADELISGQPK